VTRANPDADQRSLVSWIRAALVAIIVVTTCAAEAVAGLNKLDQASISNCSPTVNLTGTGTADITFAVVTLVAAAWIGRRWMRRTSNALPWLMAPLLALNWGLYLAIELSSGAYHYC
jgi:uncharacterized membrane protein YidH (DUF202 family)